jgi:hypothetical protein
MKIKILIIFSLVLGLVMGSTLGYLLGVAQKEKSYQQGYQTAWNEAKEKVSKVFPSPSEVKSLSGKIVKKEGSLIIMKIFPFTPNPLEEVKFPLRKVRINDKTTIVKVSLKRPEEISSEGTPFKEEPIDFSQLKEGDEINVLAKENIKEKEEFQAEKIELLQY